MLAEDDRDLRELFSRFLEEDGAMVVAVANGRDALACLQKDPFDAAILDVRMPGMTGLEVLRELARRRSTIPILLVSSFADPDLHDRAVKLGAALVLAKPLSAAELRSAVLTVGRRPTPR